MLEFSRKIHERYISTSISQDSSVSIVAGYELKGQVLIPSREFSLAVSRSVLRLTQPSMQRVPRAFSPGIKWHDSEANPMLDLRQSDQGSRPRASTRQK
jgi:hypothetical protein